MRIAKCKTPLNITVMGHGLGLPSISIGQGWQGDVDQVMGKTDRGPMTLAEGLGPHLNDTNFEFEVVTRASRKPAESRQATPAAQE